MKEKTFEITNMTKGRLPGLPFANIKEAVIGKKYKLSLVIIGDARSKSLNKKYRKRNKPANVLSFPLEKGEGEIFINPTEASRDAKKFAMTTKNFIGFLFIHGLLHLKGMRHGSKMEYKERAYRKKFNI